MEIHDSARKHGIQDADIRHAIEHYAYIANINADDPRKHVLYLGPDRAGNFLEIVTTDRDGEGELVIHAMKMRARYQTHLSNQG